VVIHPLFVREGSSWAGKASSLLTVLGDERSFSPFSTSTTGGQIHPRRSAAAMPVPEQALLEQRSPNSRERRPGSSSRPGDRTRAPRAGLRQRRSFLVPKPRWNEPRGLSRNAPGAAQADTTSPPVEAFDISTSRRPCRGLHVVFRRGSAGTIRHFKIRSIEGSDDYGMMYKCSCGGTPSHRGEGSARLALIDGGRASSTWPSRSSGARDPEVDS